MMFSPLDDEVWCVIPGYENRYEASSAGRIRRVIGKRCRYGPQLLRIFLDKKVGYERTAIMRHDGTVYKPGVHQLIAAAFLGLCPEGHEVNHIDLDKRNNRSSNLEYITHKDNIAHARQHKTWTVASEKRRFTPDQIREIRQLISDRVPRREIAKRFGTSNPMITYIGSRKIYKDVE